MILGALGNLGGMLAGAGKSMIDGLVNGISGARDAVVNKVKDIAAGALDAIKNFFGIHSPSRVMAQMGTFIGQGLANGIAGTQDLVGGVVNDLASTVTDGLNASPSMTMTANAGLTGAAARAGSNMVAGGGNTTTNTTTNQFLGTINLQSKEAVDAFMARMGRQQELAEMGVAI